MRASKRSSELERENRQSESAARTALSSLHFFGAGSDRSAGGGPRLGPGPGPTFNLATAEVLPLAHVFKQLLRGTADVNARARARGLLLRAL